MDIYADSNLLYTHCSTTHLTQFAGGLKLVPNQINFNMFLANASPAKSPLIYALLFAITLAYLAFLAWAYWVDANEAKRMGVTVLEDNLFGDSYCYEVLVFSGCRREAGTDSKVCICRRHYTSSNLGILYEN
jgi:polycystin 1L2